MKNIHTAHCCVRHGCKYGEEDCPVANGKQVQESPCGDCDGSMPTATDRKQAREAKGKILVIAMKDDGIPVPFCAVDKNFTHLTKSVSSVKKLDDIDMHLVDGEALFAIRSKGECTVVGAYHAEYAVPYTGMFEPGTARFEASFTVHDNDPDPTTSNVKSFGFTMMDGALQVGVAEFNRFPLRYVARVHGLTVERTKWLDQMVSDTYFHVLGMADRYCRAYDSCDMPTGIPWEFLQDRIVNYVRTEKTYSSVNIGDIRHETRTCRWMTAEQRARQLDIVDAFVEGRFAAAKRLYDALPYDDKEECPETEYVEPDLAEAIDWFTVRPCHAEVV